MRRIRVCANALPAGAGVLALPREEAHHIRDVLRLGAGAAVEVLDGAGNSRSGVIVRADKDGVEVALSDAVVPSVSPVAVTVAVALVKKGLDDVVRQLVEIGIARVVPITTAHTVKGLVPKAERWAHVTAEAQKQCGRAVGLVIDPVRSLRELLAERREGACFFADVGAASLLAALAGTREPPFTIAIGPEGGFTDAERGAFAAAGFQPASLGRFVLRTETAAVAAAAVLAQAFGTRETSSS